VLKLVEQRKIASLDEPVATFFPEWKQGKKAKITVRHLLQQTSGLQTEPNTQVVYASPDFVQLALAAELEGEPGAKWTYNNKAVNLLAGVVKRASGVPLDEYMRREFFAPLGITQFGWDHDQAGNPHAMSGLQLKPLDLARFGQLMLDGGVWKGRRVLAEALVRSAHDDVAPGQGYGLLWWRLEDVTLTIDDALVASWKRAGVDPALARKAATLKGRVYSGQEAFFADLIKALGGMEATRAWQAERARRDVRGATFLERRPFGYGAQGYLGQHLVVIPSERLVAVRMRRSEHGAEDDMDADFMDFEAAVRALAPADAAHRAPSR
jgi:CubicO group peptidase (beta-lactamase class C family)